jgi:phosphate transport system permease protein
VARVKLKLDLKAIIKPFQSFYTSLIDKNNLNLKNLIIFSSILFSLSLVILGFYSAFNQFYIGDVNLRILLIILSILMLIQIFYSFFELNIRKKLISMIIFTIILLLLSYFLPNFPPKYDLRQFEMSASILKFLITSIVLVIIGVFGVSNSIKPLYNFTTRSKQYSAYFVLLLSIITILIPLMLIIGNIIFNGAGGLTIDFLTQDVSRHGQEGGISKPIIGTICLIVGVAIIALPLGIGAAVYLTEYARGGIVVRIIRITVDILQGVPSIVYGLFALAFFVPIFGISLLSGILVLSFLTLPIIIRASEEAIMAVPQSIREGSYALGSTKWQTIKRVVLPPAFPGIITGGILGLGRAAGETAPIMFVAAVFIGARTIPSLFSPIQVLPYHLLQLNYYIGAYKVEQNAWTTAFILLGIVLFMNAISIIVREKFRVEF